jgi:hypothetical protein
MSDLIVIGYEDPQTARQAYDQVQRLQQDFVVDLRGLAIVNVDADGKTHVDTPSGSSARPRCPVRSSGSCSASCSSSRAWRCWAARSACSSARSTSRELAEELTGQS